MCAIIGYNGEYDEDFVKIIFENSKIRGVHAFGYSYVSSTGIITKKFIDYNKFISEINKDRPKKFVAHFRYSTSGDYNNIENNQPLSKINSSMVFNGVISQKTLEEMKEAYKIEFLSDNDGWILLEMFHSEEIKNDSRISFASILLNSDNSMVAYRNNKRPLWSGRIGSMKVIASTRDILKRSGVEEIKEVKPLIIVEC